MSFIRSTAALVLLIVAVALALLGVGSQWLDGVARTPEPVRELVGSVARDDAVVQAIAGELEAGAHRAVDNWVEHFPGLREQFEVLLRQSIDRALSNEALNQAWYASVDLTRRSAVEGLDAMRDGPGTTPVVSFPLRPFIDLAEAELYAWAEPPLDRYLQDLRFDKDVSMPLGTIPQPIATWASEGLGVARYWPWMYAAAGLLGLVGLLVGSRRGRWVALLIATGLGIGALMLGRASVDSLTLPSGSSVIAAVQNRLVTGATESVVERLDLTLIVGAALFAVALVGLSVAAASRRRRPPTGELR